MDMGDPRTAYRSMNRGFRAPLTSARPKPVSSPVGPDSTMAGARGQARSLRQMPAVPGTVSYPGGGGPVSPTASYVSSVLGAQPSSGTISALPPAAASQAEALRAEPDANSIDKKILEMAQGGYQKGGFEGVANAFGSGWYDQPESVRSQILQRARG